jgi:hypothetical protein
LSSFEYGQAIQHAAETARVFTQAMTDFFGAASVTAAVASAVPATPTSAWSGLGTFTAQLGQDHATVYGGLIGLNYALGEIAAPLVYKN